MKISTMLPWQTRNSSNSTLTQLDSKETHTTASIKSGIEHIYPCEEWSWNTSEYPNLICGHTTLNKHEPLLLRTQQGHLWLLFGWKGITVLSNLDFLGYTLLISIYLLFVKKITWGKKFCLRIILACFI